MPETSYEILLVGDFHYGESYSNGGQKVLAKNGYQYSTKYLQPFIDRANMTIINLETPVVNPQAHPSPFRATKPYIHWADPKCTPKSLRDIGVDAVSLANNHTVDHGVAGLTATLDHLSDVGITWFGAGRTLQEAQKPYVVTLPNEVGGGEVRFHGSFQYRPSYDRKFDFYATDEKPGCAPLSSEGITSVRVPGARRDVLNVAFPHWGKNYEWQSSGQRKLSKILLENEFDLILGHGSHCIQEVERRRRRWVVNSIGNGNFQSGGRFSRHIEEHGILPMGFWSVLQVSQDSSRRTVGLKLYPVYSDNRQTDFQPGPVDEGDFEAVNEALIRALPSPDLFENEDKTTGVDELGHYVHLNLGSWPVGKRFNRLPSVSPSREEKYSGAVSSAGRSWTPFNRLRGLRRHGKE